jgi:serine/threonine protein kinase
MNFEKKGFVNKAKINIIRRSEIYTYMADNALDIIDDSSELDFNNFNFNIEINGITYKDFKIIYGHSIDSNTKIIRCGDNNSIIKLYIFEHEKKDSIPEISMFNETWFYTNYNNKLDNEAIKMVDKPFHCIMWENDTSADIILGYMMEDGNKKLRLDSSNDYCYSSNDNIRLTYMNNTHFPELFKNIRKIVKNLATLHNKGIYHLDIKPDNITQDFKFMDFGCAVDVGKFYETLTDLYSGKIDQLRVGTCGFQAPELIMFKKFFKELPPIEDIPLILSQIDIFSLGCTIFYIIFGISFYEDFIGTGTSHIKNNGGINMYNELFIDMNNTKIDTRKVYMDYFSNNGYYIKLMQQLNQYYFNNNNNNIDVDIDIYIWMLQLNPHERIDMNTLSDFV